MANYKGKYPNRICTVYGGATRRTTQGTVYATPSTVYVHTNNGMRYTVAANAATQYAMPQCGQCISQWPQAVSA